MNYTKGEWKYKPVNEKFWIICDHVGYECIIAEMTENIPEMKANAYLMAAAPDMYEALQLWTQHNQGTRGHYCSECATAIEKALAKAKGRNA